MHSSDLPGYEGALHKSSFYSQLEAGYVLVSGPDRRSFIQRQTTNHIDLLKSGRFLPTVLTSPTARILDVLYLLVEDPDEVTETIAMITLPGRSGITAGFLRDRIFFNDDVKVENASQRVAQIDLIGPQAGHTLNHLGVAQIPEDEQVVEFELKGATVRVLSDRRPTALGYRLLVPSEAAESFGKALQEHNVEQLSGESYLVLRVETGQPEADYELSDDYTPLEIGLRSAISDTKGCYTGQEVIARQITYDKVTRQMVGLQLKSLVDVGEKVWADGKAVGTVTSVVESPRFGPIALAVIKRPYNEPGESLQVGFEFEAGQPATISSLPFGKK
jgi:folate-binding protein YgfZ